MPYALPEGFGNETWEPSNNEYTLVDEGIYLVNIFAVDPKKNDKGNYYGMKFRIQGGQFDGEDIDLNYVGLSLATIFRLYEILKAIGTISTYYDAEAKVWTALPSPDELIGKQLYIKVDHEGFHSSKDGNYQYNDDGSIRLLESARATRFYDPNEPKPEYRAPSQRTVNILGDKARKVPYVKGQPVFPNGGAPAAAQGQSFPAGPGAPGAQPGVPVAGDGPLYTDKTPW